jgi:hypothetical protein
MRPTFLVYFLIALTCSGFAQTTNYTLTDIQSDPENYLSRIASITINTQNQISISGIKGKERVITKNIIDEMLSIKDNESAPECVIEHTQEEADAYLLFDEKFRTRPRGHDGGLLVMEWQRNKFYQKLGIKNIHRDSELAWALYNADYSLKRMVMGKRRIRAGGVQSYAGFVQKKMYDGMSGKTGTRRNRFETIFYLVPDTIIEIKKGNSIQIARGQFRLVTYQKYSHSQSDPIAEEWANAFNSNHDKIFERHKELRIAEDLFKLYYSIKKYHQRHAVTASLRTGYRSVPERIKSIKVAEILESPSPLINEPFRIQFVWLMISGGITYDFTSATIIESK